MDKSEMTVTIPMEQFEELQKKNQAKEAWKTMAHLSLIKMAKNSREGKITASQTVNEINEYLQKNDVKLKFEFNPNRIHPIELIKI